MISSCLQRLGRVSARRPWTVIGSWVLLAVAVVGGAQAFGHELEDSFRVPGLDSQKANDLLAEAGTGQEGLTAQVVVTPSDGTTTFFESAPARAELAKVQSGAAALPNVLATSDPVGDLAQGSAAARASGARTSSRRPTSRTSRTSWTDRRCPRR
jgi:RND superfamily putative drug exporter